MTTKEQMSSKALLLEVKKTLIPLLNKLSAGKAPLTEDEIQELTVLQENLELIHTRMERKFLFRNTRVTSELKASFPKIVSMIKSLNKLVPKIIELDASIGKLHQTGYKFSDLINTALIAKECNEMVIDYQYHTKLPLFQTALAKFVRRGLASNFISQIEEKLSFSNSKKEFQELYAKYKDNIIEMINVEKNLQDPNFLQLLYWLHQNNIDLPGNIFKNFINSNPGFNPNMMNGLQALFAIKFVQNIAKASDAKDDNEKEKVYKMFHHITSSIEKSQKRHDYEIGLGTYWYEPLTEDLLPYYSQAIVLKLLLKPSDDDVKFALLDMKYKPLVNVLLYILGDTKLKEYLDTSEILKQFFKENDLINLIVKSIVDRIDSSQESTVDKNELLEKLNSINSYINEPSRKYILEHKKPLPTLESLFPGNELIEILDHIKMNPSILQDCIKNGTVTKQQIINEMGCYLVNNDKDANILTINQDIQTEHQFLIDFMTHECIKNVLVTNTKGHLYDKSTLDRWFETQESNEKNNVPTDPFTREPKSPTNNYPEAKYTIQFLTFVAMKLKNTNSKKLGL